MQVVCEIGIINGWNTLIVYIWREEFDVMVYISGNLLSRPSNPVEISRE